MEDQRIEQLANECYAKALEIATGREAQKERTLDDQRLMSDRERRLPADPTDEGGELADVLVFRRRKKPSAGGLCLHRRLNLDQHDRTLWCDRCGADVDPFYALNMYANQHCQDLIAVQAARGLWVAVERFIRKGGQLTIGKKTVRGKIGDILRSFTPQHGQPIEPQIRTVIEDLNALRGRGDDGRPTTSLPRRRGST